MWHCHFEDVEHVSMGMTGVVFVQPDGHPKWTYDDPNTAFDRDFPMIVTEVWAQERWRDAHIQENDWSDYLPDFWALNGRVYPDTIAPNGPGFDPDTGDLLPYDNSPQADNLRYQPISSLVTCNEGEKVLIRIVNLGFQQQTMRADGITFHVVGKDAKPLGALAYDTDSFDVGVGESFDAIFVAPPKTGAGTYDKYVFGNSNLARLHNPGVSGYGGQMTEIWVFPANTLPAQQQPNDQALPV